MKQLHIVNDIGIKNGGLGSAALGTAIALAKEENVEIDIFVCQVVMPQLPYPNNLINFFLITNKYNNIIYLLFKLLYLIKNNNYDLIHIHGLWTPILCISCFFSRLKNIPYFLSPHGSLEPWALNHKKLKKIIAMFLYQRTCIEKASVIFASSYKEYHSFRKLGIVNPVAIIPFGINFKEE